MLDIKKEALKMVIDLQNMSKNAYRLRINNENVRRLKRRAIAELAEDRLAEFVFTVLNGKEYKVYINANLNGVLPDIIVIRDNVIIGIIELKMNFGWCRYIFDPMKNNKLIYDKKSQIHDRVKEIDKLQNNEIIFNDGESKVRVRIAKNCKIFYVSTSLENYISARNMIDDFKDFIKRNSRYKDKISFSVMVETYHNKNGKGWPSKDDIDKSIEKLFNTEYGINKMIETIKNTY